MNRQTRQRGEAELAKRYCVGFAIATIPIALFMACADPGESDPAPVADAAANDAQTLPLSDAPSGTPDAGADSVAVADADAREDECTPGGWCVVAVPEDASVHAVWGRAADDVYFAGEGPSDGGSVPYILHYDGNALSVVYRGQATGSFRAIHGSETGDTWAVGATPRNGPIIARGSGNTLAFEPVDVGITSQGLQSVWVADDNDVWAVPARAPLLRYSSVHVGDGGNGEPEWHPVSFPATVMGSGIAGARSGEIVVGTQSSGPEFYVGTEGAWSRVHLTRPTSRLFTVSGIWLSPANGTWLVVTPNNLQATGALCSSRAGGDVSTLDDAGTWRMETSTVRLSAVWGTAEDDVWAVGPRGLILHFDGTAFQISPTAVKGVLQRWTLRSIWGSSSTDIWAAGGVLVRRKEGAE